MSERVKPLQVSPVIKVSRYLSLTCGIIYGVMKLNTFQFYEVTAKPKREMLLKEKAIREKTESIFRMREDMVNLVKDLELPDVTPGWEKDLK